VEGQGEGREKEDRVVVSRAGSAEPKMWESPSRHKDAGMDDWLGNMGID